MGSEGIRDPEEWNFFDWIRLAFSSVVVRVSAPWGLGSTISGAVFVSLSFYWNFFPEVDALTRRKKVSRSASNVQMDRSFSFKWDSLSNHFHTESKDLTV